MALTKHPEGSLRELCAIAFPLMLSAFSVMSMLFVDRVLLAKYSLEALNASVSASTFGWCFIFSWMMLVGITEVFVAQYNGAKQLHKLGEPVWQMIWLSLASFVFFTPLALWFGPVFFQQTPYYELEREYFKWMMLFGPFYALYSALCGFYIGQGKTYLITVVAVVANVVNAALDYVLIFGIPGWVYSYGIKGAAIATCLSTVLQVVVLGAIFLSAKNRARYGTGLFRFNFESCWKCFKVGIPNSVFAALEVMGWGLFYTMMAGLGDRYITIAGICQSIVIMFYFFCEGIGKATSALAGNFIGAKAVHQVPKVIRAGIRLNFLFFLAMISVCWFSESLVIELFLKDADAAFVESIWDSLSLCLLSIAFYLLFEGIRYSLSGVLTAAGDTVFQLIAGTLSVWLLMVLPVRIFVVEWGAPIEYALFIGVFYIAALCLIYFWRYLQGGWQKSGMLIQVEN